MHCMAGNIEIAMQGNAGNIEEETKGRYGEAPSGGTVIYNIKNNKNNKLNTCWKHVIYVVNKNTIYLLFGIAGAIQQSGQIQSSQRVQTGEVGHSGYSTSITLSVTIH